MSQASIAEYGCIETTNNFTLASGITQYALTNLFYELTSSKNLRNGWPSKTADHFNKSQAQQPRSQRTQLRKVWRELLIIPRQKDGWSS